jgi:hypothetical protein
MEEKDIKITATITINGTLLDVESWTVGLKELLSNYYPYLVDDLGDGISIDVSVTASYRENDLD